MNSPSWFLPINQDRLSLRQKLKKANLPKPIKDSGPLRITVFFPLFVKQRGENPS